MAAANNSDECQPFSLASTRPSRYFGSMRRGNALLAVALFIAGAALAHPAKAARQVYEYRVVHGTYGDIGHYTNTIDRAGDEINVETELRIAVKILGVVVYREEASRSEHWRRDRLVSFEGVTVTNGDKLEVRGEARGGAFAITTPSGTVLVPGNVHPSNPWSAMILNTDAMMSTRTGRFTHVRVTGGELEAKVLNGSLQPLHKYEIDSDKRQFVWLDDHGMPVAFRTEESGSSVDFILARPPDEQ
jgi:hypothetical protein